MSKFKLNSLFIIHFLLKSISLIFAIADYGYYDNCKKFVIFSFISFLLGEYYWGNDFVSSTINFKNKFLKINFHIQ